jgi:surface carbohydrate biosynthesis protein (TIGR04326 family)
VLTENKIQENILIVSEFEDKFGANGCDLINWNSYFFSKKNSIFSLPKIINENQDNLKSKYLKLIFNLGKIKINDKSLVDCLEIRPNLSYWWMTLLSEKCNGIKSPQIDNAIKLLAFEEWLNSSHYSKILFKSSNVELAEAVRILSHNHGVDFEWYQLKNMSNNYRGIKYLFYKLPVSFQALVWLMNRLIHRWNLKGAGVREWKNSKATITVVSYLFNLHPESAKKGIFMSNYWTVLPDELKKNNLASNWLHLYNQDTVLPSSKSARTLINKLNNSDSKDQVHTTLDSFLSIKVVINVLRDWVVLLRLNLKIKKLLSKSSGFLWPLMKSDFDSSMLGAIAINNLLNLNLFQKAMSLVPEQDKGFYLQENHAWEYSFISSWRSSNHGACLVGIPHTTIKYWDLRYFFDKQSYSKGIFNCSLPLPDYVGVNGKDAKKMLISNGYPKHKILEVEALRFLYLKDIETVGAINNQQVLILSGNNVKNQMKLLNSANDLLNDSIKFVIKTDPWNPIILSESQKLRMNLTTDSISELLGKYNVVYTDNITSAAADAFCMGKRVITALDPSKLNQSPLLGYKDVLFVSSPEQLAEALNGFSNFGHVKRDFFYLDPDLPRWKRLINSK